MIVVGLPFPARYWTRVRGLAAPDAKSLQVAPVGRIAPFGGIRVKVGVGLGVWVEVLVAVLVEVLVGVRVGV